ncbi:MAG: class I SAM-dependent methyltransferase, partial [candidate division Zixibacteria bacterium]|nr:class I SAM-dependent methyltransferase [candidate division Zixibacteria bacterium]
MTNQIFEKDLYGRVCFDYFKAEVKGNPYLVRDDNFRDSFDVANYFGFFESFAPVEKKLLEFAKSSKVLDVGCGPGRFALYFQEKGWDVTAIDNSPYIVNIAKERGVRKVIFGSIQNVDLSAKSFDTILLLGNNIGIA